MIPPCQKTKQKQIVSAYHFLYLFFSLVCALVTLHKKFFEQAYIAPKRKYKACSFFMERKKGEQQGEIFWY